MVPSNVRLVFSCKIAVYDSKKRAEGSDSTYPQGGSIIEECERYHFHAKELKDAEGVFAIH